MVMKTSIEVQGFVHGTWCIPAILMMLSTFTWILASSSSRLQEPSRLLLEKP
jgi:hypothetical protein